MNLCLRIVAVVGCVLLSFSPTSAQETDPEHPPGQRAVPDQPVAGVFHYVIIDVRADRVIARGQVRTEADIHTGLLLPAQRRYREGILHARTLHEGWSEFVTPRAGQSFKFPSTLFSPPSGRDLDQDGLTDTAEYIVGTDPGKADSDGDGLMDGAEVMQGTNPLDDTPSILGPVAQARVGGLALDVDALNDFVAVAAGEQGVALFNVGLGLTPILIGQVDTPGEAKRVALTTRFAVAADGASGLAVIALEGLNAFSTARRIPLGPPALETASAVAAAGPLVIAGTAQGSLFVVDPATGGTLLHEHVSGPVQDLTLAGDLLLVVTGHTGAFSTRTLHLFRVDGIQLIRTATLALGRYGPEGLTGSSRVSAGNGFAYVTAFVGFDVVDISDPQLPRIVAPARDQAPNSFKQIVPNGSGLGVAAVGINPGAATGHNLWLYDLSVPTNNTAFLSLFSLPGRTRAVAVFNGLAYVAASEAGLQVVSYQPFDKGGIPPEITLQASFPIQGLTARAEEGKLVRVTAAVQDDAQVRQVQFYLDGQRIATDGNFPFEVRFTTPGRADGRTNFLFRAVAIDTGGNTNSTPSITVELVPDATPPFVTVRLPEPESFSFDSLRTLSIGFNEPIDASAIHLSQFSLKRAGADAILGTSDDVTVPNEQLEYVPAANLLTLRLTAPLPTDAYEIRVAPPIGDLASNFITSPITWGFTVINPNDAGGVDSDGDGVADGIERILGLNPADASDGQRDLDGDGLGTAIELQLGFNPRKSDSDSNGIPDGQEDLDLDGLSTAVEIARGTDPRRADTDGDGWPDEAEVTAGSNPLSAASKPVLHFAALPQVEVIAPRAVFGPGVSPGITVARPLVEIIAPRAVFGPGISLGMTLAKPPVELIAPRAVFGTAGSSGTTLARPSVEVLAPRAVFGSGMSLGMALALPPVELLAPRAVFGTNLNLAPVLANPPVTIQFQQ
jgi:hypothetical protein